MKIRAGIVVLLIALLVGASSLVPPTDRAIVLRSVPNSMGASVFAGGWPTKPTPPIAIDYEIIGEPQVGRPLEIELSVHASMQMTNVSIALYGDERVAVTGFSESRTVARVPSDEVVVRRILATPLVGGALAVNVLVEADVAGQRQARTIAIQFQIGPAAAASDTHGTLQRDKSGELLLSLPASDSH